MRERTRPSIEADSPDAPDDTVIDSLASHAQTFGEYELLGELARGGMGRVYRARHRKLGRTVALKRILPAHVGSIDAVRRFETEARAAARLDHPGIVPVFEVGSVDGEHFFTMALMPGPSLQDLMQTRPLEPPKAVEYVKRLAAAVQYAHEQGVVHRDLKPSNVLLDSDGRPCVTDFGLAKSAESKDQTLAGEVLGSPNYMAPEQAQGLTDQIGVATDIYGLGAVLYGLLTGRPPFQAASVPETVRQVAELEPVRPRELDQDIQRDLETIVLKAIEKQPARRYSSAAALADDLQRFLDDRPVIARPAPWLERAVRWAKRNKPIAAAIIGLVITLAGLSTSAVLVRQQRGVAEANLRRANQQRALAESNFEMAVGAVDEFFTQVSEDTLLSEPGMRPLRKSLLESARRFYDEMADKGQSTVASNVLRVNAITKQAQIVELIESTAAARVLFEEAIAEIRQIQGYNADAEWLTKLGHAESRLAAMIFDMGELGVAYETLQDADAHLQQALELEPQRMDTSVYRAILLRRICTYHSRRGDLPTCLPLLEEAESILNEQAALHDESGVRIELGRALRASGVTYLSMGQHEQANQKFEQAIDTYRSIEDPDAALDARWLTAELQALQGKCLARMNQQRQAALVTTDAITALSDLSEQFPLTDRFTIALGKAYQQLGSTYWNLRDFVTARENYKLALQTYRQLAAKRPEIVTHRVSVVRAIQNIGITFEYTNDHADAERNYHDAVQALSAIIETHPDQANLRSDLVRLQGNLGTSRMNLGKWTEAEATLSLAMNMARRHLESHPDSLDAIIGVGEAAMALGNCLRWTGREQESLAIFDEGIALVQPKLAELDGHASMMRSAHSCWFDKALALYQLSRWEHAREAFERSLEFAASDYDRFIVNSFMQMIVAQQGDHLAGFEFVASASAAAERAGVDTVELNRTRAYLLASCYQGARNDKELTEANQNEVLSKYREACFEALQAVQDANGFSALTERLELALFPAFDGLRDEADFPVRPTHTDTSFSRSPTEFPRNPPDGRVEPKARGGLKRVRFSGVARGSPSPTATASDPPRGRVSCRAPFGSGTAQH